MIFFFYEKVKPQQGTETNYEAPVETKTKTKTKTDDHISVLTKPKPKPNLMVYRQLVPWQVHEDAPVETKTQTQSAIIVVDVTNGGVGSGVGFR